jgi:hypothetical protein
MKKDDIEQRITEMLDASAKRFPKEAKKAILIEKEAHELADSVIAEVDLHTADKWDALSPEQKRMVTPLQMAENELGPILMPLDDIQKYGKALIIGQHEINKRFESRSKSSLFTRIFNNRKCQQMAVYDRLLVELMCNTFTFFMCMRIKQDILDNYEIKETKGTK